MSSMFAAPSAPGGGLNFAELEGSLLLVDVTGVEDHVPTVHTQPGQKTPAVRANVTVLDGPQADTAFEDTLIFPKVLQGQLRSRVGQKVLGRLIKGQAKPGQNAPWVLDAATAQDVAVADAWVKRSTPAFGNAEAPF